MLSIYIGKKIVDFALSNSESKYGNFSPLFVVIYLGVAFSMLSINISWLCKFSNVLQCFSFTFDASIVYLLPSKITIVEYFISYFSINISFILVIFSFEVIMLFPIIFIKSCIIPKEFTF